MKACWSKLYTEAREGDHDEDVMMSLLLGKKNHFTSLIIRYRGALPYICIYMVMHFTKFSKFLKTIYMIVQKNFAAFGGVFDNLYLYFMFTMVSDKFWKHSTAAGAIFTNSEANWSDFSLRKQYFQLQKAQFFACGAPKKLYIW